MHGSLMFGLGCLVGGVFGVFSMALIQVGHRGEDYDFDTVPAPDEDTYDMEDMEEDDE